MITVPISLGQVNCLEIQILSQTVFSFSLPINVLIYNGRVDHLEGNLLPLHRNVQYTSRMRGLIYYLVIMCASLALKKMSNCTASTILSIVNTVSKYIHWKAVQCKFCKKNAMWRSVE